MPTVLNMLTFKSILREATAVYSTFSTPEVRVTLPRSSLNTSFVIEMDYCSSLIFASFVLCCTGTSLEKSILLLQYVCKLSFGKISYHLQIGLQSKSTNCFLYDARFN